MIGQKEAKKSSDKKDKLELAPLSRVFIGLSKWDKAMFIIAIIFACISGWVMPGFAILFSEMLDEFDPDNNTSTLVDSIKVISKIFLAMGVFLCITTYIFFGFAMIISEKVGYNFRYRYLEAVLKKDTKWFDESNFQELPTKISRDCQGIQKASGEKFIMTINAFSASGAGFVVAFILGWKYAFCLLLMVPFIFWGIIILIKSLKAGFIGHAAAYNKSGAYAEQALNAIKVVSAFGQEETEKKSYCAYLENSRSKGVKSSMKTALGFTIFAFLMHASYAYGLYIGGVFVYEKVYNESKQHDFSAGDVIGTFFGILIGIFTLGMASPNFKSTTEGRLNAASALKIMDHVPDIKLDEEGKEMVEKIEGNIGLRDISFTYPQKEVPAVKKLNCIIEQGWMTAFVGASGSGKSTITKLIERFYDPTEGEVIVNGKNLKEFNLRSYRQRIGYVGQEPVLFNQTIRENILYGNPNATEEEIIEALKKANAYDFVMEKNLLDANVGSSGSQLSGGQKQRIALARAFIKNPDVLILDEATSALDRKNEAQVQKAIDNIQNSKTSMTSIVIAHRLSTIRNADKIIVMKSGEIVEVGTHDSLLKDHPDGVYSLLVKRQQFIDEDIEENEVEDEVSHGDFELAKRKSSMKDADFLNDLKSKTQIANDEFEQRDAEQAEILKKKSKGIFWRLVNYNNPKMLIFIGTLGAFLQSFIHPVFGIFFAKILFAMMKNSKDEIKNGVESNALYMFLVALSGLISNLLMRCSFGVLAENMTRKIRATLYLSILKKHMGWFDKEENSPGQLTNVLSGEVQIVNGASTEGIVTLIEGIFTLMIGITLAFIFEWRMALLCLGTSPFVVTASFIRSSMMSGVEKKREDKLKKANSLISDAIINNLTVASFGHEYLLVEKYKENLQANLKGSIRNAHIEGLIYGLSQLINYCNYGLLFWAGAKFVEVYHIDPENMFIAIFIIMFSSWGTAQSQQHAPSATKGKKSAIRIFGIVDEESELDPLMTDESQVIADSNTFKGNIEFKDVWFRYPTRRDHWVLKGVNLSIKSNTIVGIAGESGCGKSTIVQLIYRFYDPQFGQILIDGVDIRDYNVASLRRQFGLVQQEPVLFNYSIRENICYAKADATNEEVMNAAEIANATEFIATLKDHIEKDADNEEDEAMVLFNTPENENNITVLDDIPPGYSISWGVKGGKLSGGQKQRIAIARAIIRQPHILMLDEATSALDEESQNKVQVALDRIMDDRTSIVIAHRLTTIQKWDNIIVLRNGRVEEEGQFSTLINKKNGYFAQISKNLES